MVIAIFTQLSMALLHKLTKTNPSLHYYLLNCYFVVIQFKTGLVNNLYYNRLSNIN